MTLDYSQIIATPMGDTCPGCGRSKQSIKLVHHHVVDLDTNILYAYEICSSCNSALGKRYHDNYPSWEEQLGFLNYHQEKHSRTRRLVKLYLAAGLNQSEAAREIGVSRQRVSQILLEPSVT